VIVLQYSVRILTEGITGMFVVSSSHADPMEEFSKLTQHQHTQQHQQPHKLPKWFSPNILRYYVLVHDVTEQAEAKYVLLLLLVIYTVPVARILKISFTVPAVSNHKMNQYQLLTLTLNQSLRGNHTLLQSSAYTN